MARYTEAEKAENAAVKVKGLPGPWAGHSALGGLGLIRRGIQQVLAGPGPETAPRALLPTGGSQGNAGAIRRAPTTGRIGRGGLASGVQEVAAAPWQEAYADPRHGGMVSRTGDQMASNSTLTKYDRHIMAKSGTERQQAHPDSTRGDGYSPLADGPARPSYMMVHRTYNATYGTTGTRFLDNSAPKARTVDSMGRPQPLGTQDGSPWTSKWGGAPGLTHIYGVRGSTGTVGPAAGSPQDAPQKIRGGAPHGLHTKSQSNRALTQSRSKSTPQQVRRRPQLVANSKQAGQSYSQTVQHLGGPPSTVPRVPGRPLPGAAGRITRRG